MTEKELEIIKKKAQAFDWLTDGKRDDYIWYHVLSQEDRDLGNHLDECIYLAMERDK